MQGIPVKYHTKCFHCEDDLTLQQFAEGCGIPILGLTVLKLANLIGPALSREMDSTSRGLFLPKLFSDSTTYEMFNCFFSVDPMSNFFFRAPDLIELKEICLKGLMFF